MSESLEVRYVAPGEDDYLSATWRLKQRIRRTDGVLAQGKRFFRFQYRRCAVHLVLRGDAPVAFAVVRSDGYLSLLGVDPDHRRRGLGRRLVARVAENRDRVTCHTRADNDGAVAFYTDIGFAVVARSRGYYRDGTDALELELDGESERTLDRIMDVLDG